MNAQSAVASRQAGEHSAWWLTPLKIRGDALPPNLLLAARLLTLCFIGTGQILHLSSHFLPFVPFFDRLGSPATFHWTLTAAFLFGTILLFFTRFGRTACLLLSSVLFVSLLSSRMYFENNRTFCACIFLLISLSSAKQKPWLVRLQVRWFILALGSTSFSIRTGAQGSSSPSGLAKSTTQSCGQGSRTLFPA